MTDWGRVRHFQRAEFRYDPDRLEPDVVYLLDEMRDAIGKSIVIHVAWDNEGHVADSSHYTLTRDFATAVDFHVVGVPLLDQWLFAERFPWNGLGVYPYWEHPGLHCDLRRIGRDHPHLGKRWWRDAHGQYRPIDRDFLKVVLTEAEALR